MGLVLTSISLYDLYLTMNHEDDINWRLALLYGRRVIDSRLAVLFAEQSTLSLNHSVALSYV